MYIFFVPRSFQKHIQCDFNPLNYFIFFSKLSTRSIPCTKLSFFFFFLVFSLFIKLIVTFFSYRQIAQAIHRVGVAFKAVQACLETVQSETRMFHLTTLFLQKKNWREGCLQETTPQTYLKNVKRVLAFSSWATLKMFFFSYEKAYFSSHCSSAPFLSSQIFHFFSRWLIRVPLKKALCQSVLFTEGTKNK